MSGMFLTVLHRGGFGLGNGIFKGAVLLRLLRSSFGWAATLVRQLGYDN